MHVLILAGDIDWQTSPPTCRLRPRLLRLAPSPDRFGVSTTPENGPPTGLEHSCFSWCKTGFDHIVCLVPEADVAFSRPPKMDMSVFPIGGPLNEPETAHRASITHTLQKSQGNYFGFLLKDERQREASKKRTCPRNGSRDVDVSVSLLQGWGMGCQLLKKEDLFRSPNGGHLERHSPLVGTPVRVRVFTSGRVFGTSF